MNAFIGSVTCVTVREPRHPLIVSRHMRRRAVAITIESLENKGRFDFEAARRIGETVQVKRKSMVGSTGIGIALFAAIGFATPASVEAQCAAPPSIGGIWKANDGGTYRLRTHGNEVWWIGTSGDNGRSWTNVFRGTRTGDVIKGDWADIGRNLGRGTLTLRVSGTAFMEKIGATGSGFGGQRWGRGGCNDTVGNPG
jgi:hypothetical protein